ncbi:MAG: tRNA (guanosine(37)-N1)-methyltransferase TrmD [Patescibacteria group bacterium]
MKFDVISIFPTLFDSFMSESLLKKALDKKLIAITVHDLRAFAVDKHKTVDDKPYGGGAGMLMKIDPLVKALESIKRNKKSRVILLSPAGKQFDQKRANTFAKKYDQLIFVCGRYEGVDARIKKFIDEELSIGPYVLNGGEVAAMAVIEAVSRLLPGVLGNPESLAQESHVQEGAAEYPQYTRPELFRRLKVPKILLSGDHKKISEWRAKKTVRK